MKDAPRQCDARQQWVLQYFWLHMSCKCRVFVVAMLPSLISYLQKHVQSDN